ncbi:MAG: PEP-CTERM sorting domain-containing protein [Acidobacteria bacterium]|nr:PEP-CTERM sorting domain-containing protein [Acidobacteriota bacterium]
MKRILSLVAFTALLLASAPECKAVAFTTLINFSGVCADCEGNGLGTLEVTGFTPGSPFTLTLSNFVSFSYAGTDILPPFTITSPTTAEGLIGPGFPGAYDVIIEDSLFSFQSTISGFWSIGEPSRDFGFVSAYNVAIPEPSAFGMMAAGFAGLLAAVRRRRA